MFNILKKLAAIRNPLRPPGALEEQEFNQQCIRCRKCETVCPYDSIKMAHGEWGTRMGTPLIFAREIPCYLCEDLPCITVCPTEALQPLTDIRQVRMGIAVIDTTTCFPYLGIICRACYERCPIYREAITLEEEIYPVVNTDICVGCGICEAVCPLEEPAITIKSAHSVTC